MEPHQGQTCDNMWFYSEVLHFSESIIVKSADWKEVTPYTRIVDIGSLLFMDLSVKIPLSGNSLEGARTRLRLMLDDIEVGQSAIFSGAKWNLGDIHISGRIFNVPDGFHTIKILAAVDKGEFHFPHISYNHMEKTKLPEMVGKIDFSGMLKIRPK